MIVEKIEQDYDGFKFTKGVLFMYIERRKIDFSDVSKNIIVKEKENFRLVSEKDLNQEKEIINPILFSPNEFPLKGDEILVEQLDGTYLIQKANKNLSNKDLYVESSRMVFKILIKEKILNNKDYFNCILNKNWKEGELFKVELENKIYNKNNLKESEIEVDYIFYDSSKSIFKIKNPIFIKKM